MKKKQIGKIIFSKVLEMSLEKYLAFIEETTKELTSSFSTHESDKKKLFYAKVMIKNETLCFEISDKRLETIYSTENCNENKTVYSLNWINTRNKFSLHILESIIDYQREYWFSGKKTNLRPLTYKKFLSLYPLQYLGQSRLSRLVSNLPIINPQNQVINLRSLFISKKRYYSYHIKEIINNNENTLKDRGIQCLLGQEGIHLSIRTICNCRKLLNIPNYKERTTNYYGRDINFSEYIVLSKNNFNKIPHKAGVYELSIPSKIGYPNYKSNVIYIGTSKNLRKRLANYTGNKLKNRDLKRFIDKYDVFVRLHLTEDHIKVEKRLLKNFRNIYKELPKANKIGG